MKPLILHPLGRAEPNDLQGWLEHGGGLGLQMAWQLSPAELRARLSHLRRRDGLGLLETTPIPEAVVRIDLSNPVQRALAEEMPAYIIEGALIWARACESAHVLVRMAGDTAVQDLWREVLAAFRALAVVGETSWTGVDLTLAEGPDGEQAENEAQAPDARTVRIMPLVLWEHVDPPVTLIQTAGKFGSNGFYEIPLGLTIREFAFQWAGGVPLDGTLVLGGRMLTKSEWQLPLTYEEWGADLGWGLLECM
ncbi:MAG: hypothetical protein M3Y37_08850 [Chloroflexota bacterium]|nr:hypothetical protein [Chloroflexota bacterium]